MPAAVERHSFRVEAVSRKPEYRRCGSAIRRTSASGGGPHLSGTVSSRARAIAEPDIAGRLSNVNPTFHRVRPAQRASIPPIYRKMSLTAGMACTIAVAVKPGAAKTMRARRTGLRAGAENLLKMLL